MHNRNADIASRIRAQAEGSIIVDGYDPFKDRKRDVKEGICIVIRLIMPSREKWKSDFVMLKPMAEPFHMPVDEVIIGPVPAISISPVSQCKSH